MFQRQVPLPFLVAAKVRILQHFIQTDFKNSCLAFVSGMPKSGLCLISG
jgi:hypothetical protein